MAETTTLTIRLPKDHAQRLDTLAKNSRRRTSTLAAEAVARYLAWREWFDEEVRRGVEAADDPNARWVDHEEVRSLGEQLGY